jgi:hypothetical protein
VWFYVHLFLVGCPIPVSYTRLSSCGAIQLPCLTSQILENIRRQSVEGLALPFLANWLLGTINICVNSISTSFLAFRRSDQPHRMHTHSPTPIPSNSLCFATLRHLKFITRQTLLASYFCVVDVVLLSQYFYYRKTATPTVSAFTQPRSRAGSLVYHPSRERASSHYRTLSTAAANVASAAAVLASQRNEPPTQAYSHTRWSRRSLDGLLDNDPRRLSQQGDDEVDEDALAMLGDSIHSERSGLPSHGLQSRESRPRISHSRSGSRQGVPSSSIPPLLQITSTVEDFDPLARGRSLRRANLPSLDRQGEHDWTLNEEGSQRRRSSGANKRGASMVFMSTWALFGIGTLGLRRYGAESGVVVQPGRVLSSSSSALPSLPFPSPPHESSPLAAVSLVFDTTQYESVSKGRPRTAGPSWEHVIGRISAWACTTLYLTSRLPQIWKNVRV